MISLLRPAAGVLTIIATLAAGCGSLGVGTAQPPAVPLPPSSVLVAAGQSPADAPIEAAAAEASAAWAAAAQAEAAMARLAAAPAPPRPKGRLDLWSDADRTSLWDRVRAGLAVADLDDAWVRKWEQHYATRPDYVQRMMQRGSRYLFHIVEEVHRRGLPMELALLPFIESAFDPQAMSRARASGMWQFMPATGKDMELRQNLFRDDRRDVLASTAAALEYLQQLHKRFGDWHLALAAYNWGMGNVQRAVDRQQRAGLPADYANLRGLPAETREYVRKLQAMKNIVLRPEAFALVLPPLENHPFFVTLPIERDIDVALVARLADLPIEQFRQLNPQLEKPVILAAGTPQVLLPYDNANRFVRALAEHRGARASWTAWIAPRTLKPAEAAKLVGMPELELREVNLIPARMLVRMGSTLLVPRALHSSANVAEHIADHAALSLAPEARKKERAKARAAKPVSRTARPAPKTSVKAAATKRRTR